MQTGVHLAMLITLSVKLHGKFTSEFTQQIFSHLETSEIKLFPIGNLLWLCCVIFITSSKKAHA